MNWTGTVPILVGGAIGYGAALLVAFTVRRAVRTVVRRWRREGSVDSG